MKVKTRINHGELFFLLIQTMVGVGVLSLPHYTYEFAHQDGWISVIIAGCIVLLMVLLIWLLCRRFPNRTLYDFSQLILGKSIGKIINFLYIGYFLIIVSYVLLVMNDIVIRWILPHTPRGVLVLVGLFVLIYGCLGTMKNVVDLFSFLFIFILLLFLISLLPIVNLGGDIRYIFPIGSSGIVAILQGVQGAFPNFTGFETLLIYFAFVKQPKKRSAIKGPLYAVIFTTGLYTHAMLITTAIFSPDEMSFIPEPVLFMLRAVDIQILQRFDLIFLSISVISVATNIISFAYLGSMGISKLIRIKHKVAVIIASIVVLIICFLINEFVDMNVFRTWAKNIIFIFSILIPILLLLIAVIFKKEALSNDETH